MSDKKKLVITIDGPAGSGKSTTAKRVAEKLSYLYLDSGALYRAITLAAIRQRVDLSDPKALTELAERCLIHFAYHRDGIRVFLDDEDVTEAIRMPKVNKSIAPIAGNEGVRKALLQRQREMGVKGGIVAEGRDMGTVVFPSADLKFYIIASISERSKRRQKELMNMGVDADLETIKSNLHQRDKDDSSRAISPLLKPEHAIEIDTTRLTIEQQVDLIVSKAIEYGAELANL